MCGRYVLKMQRQLELVSNVSIEDWPQEDRYNVCPTQEVPVIRSVGGKRQGIQLRWGLVPFFAKGKPGPYSTINARMETMTTQNSYRGPWIRGQRCLQLASGFYEWHEASGRKSPYYIHLADQEMFAFASLWDRSAGEDTVIESCAIITLAANELMYDIHNTGNSPHRMPAILKREDCETWLSGSPEEARAVLRPYPAELMVAYEVSTRVNSPKNQGPELIVPLK